MAVLVNQFVQITARMYLFQQECLNVSYYRTTGTGWGTGIPMTDVLDAYNDSVLDAVRAIQHNDVEYVSLDGLNLSDAITIGSLPLSVSGLDMTAESMPTYVAWTFRLIRSTAATRHGYKRFCGVPESAVTNGTLDSAYDTNVAALEVLLAGTLTVDTDADLVPVIIKRPLGILPNPLESIYSDVAASDFRGFGTQNTRKELRG